MKAFNSRKNPKEHFLFKFKGQKLNFINTEYCGIKKSVSFKILRRNKTTYLKTIKSFDRGSEFFEIINNKIGIYNTSDYIKHLEKIHGIKIKDLGFKTKDFKEEGAFEKILIALKTKRCGL